MCSIRENLSTQYTKYFLKTSLNHTDIIPVLLQDERYDNKIQYASMQVDERRIKPGVYYRQ